MNILESIGCVMSCVFIVSIRYPLAAVILMAVVLLGRVIYFFGYGAKGPKGRIVGFLMATVCGLLPLIIMAIVTVFTIDPKTVYSFPPV